MKQLFLSTAGRLVHFDRDASGNTSGNGRNQLEGSVALHNMLVRNRVAYLADEVGMGKTYVALGVIALLRHFHPDSRVVVLAPRENIQHKWIKEYRNFVDRNWQRIDNSVKGVDRRPARDLKACHSLPELAREAVLSANQELFLRMTSFSPAFGGKEPQKAMRWAKSRLLSAMPHLPTGTLDRRSKHDAFRDEYGQLINVTLPKIDLLVVDEAHNYKKGYQRRAALRNHLTALVFGRPGAGSESIEGYEPKVQRLLLLSATPFETDYVDVFNQLDVFGFGDVPILDSAGARIGRTQILGPEADASDRAALEEKRRALLQEVMVRRVTGLRIGEELHTKNMYRREWRAGGYQTHDLPMSIEDPKQRLIVALVQKKVAEVLGSDRFNNQFQIGMLSSFESFLQSTTRKNVSLRESGEEESEERVFDGEQSELDADEKRGIDARPLANLLKSYRRRFGKALPHPKLDATVDELRQCFDTGEKALVFVRRLATMGELAARLNDHYDHWILEYMARQLPELGPKLREYFARYQDEKSGRTRKKSAPIETGESVLAANDAPDYVDEDVSGTESFFAWFFRGKENRGFLSGAAFQKNRLMSPSSAYAILFDEDHVASLLGAGAGDDVVSALAEALGRSRQHVARELKRRAHATWLGITSRRDAYGKGYVFEAYQVAGLKMLAQSTVNPGVAEKAELMHQEAFPTRLELEGTTPPGFPEPEANLGATTFITLLRQHPELEAALLPASEGVSFSDRFLERERRRELLSAMCRLGASYVDLYLLAIRALGSFELTSGGTGRSGEARAETLAQGFIDLLMKVHQSDQVEGPKLAGFHCYQELTQAASAFQDIIATNFPDVRDRRIWELRRTFGSLLQNQNPVATSSGAKVKRLVGQFRMPGYPFVLVTTDILQEGEDLHTFCAKIIHYGITWTPSAVEQRTGRVDRIGSLTERRLDQRASVSPDEKIQVYYPHLRDTVEVLQVERVLRRLNRFVSMIHSNVELDQGYERRIDTAAEMVAVRPDIAPIEHKLESAFPIQAGWLDAEGGDASDVVGLDQTESLLKHFKKMWLHLEKNLGVVKTGSGRIVESNPTGYEGLLRTEAGEAEEFEVELAAERAGTATLYRVSAKVGVLDLNDLAIVEQLGEVQRQLGYPKICMKEYERLKAWETSVTQEMLFHPATTQRSEVERLVVATVNEAREIRETLSAVLIKPKRQKKGRAS